MAYAILIASLTLLFVFSYMFFQFGKNTGSEHVVFQLVLFGLITALVFIIGGSAYQADNCDVVLVNSTQVGADFIYNYDRVCMTTPNPGSDTFLNYTVWVVRIFNIYLVGYLVFKLFGSLEKLTKITNKFKKKL